MPSKRTQLASLILDDGTVYKGKLFGAAECVAGEVVFPDRHGWISRVSDRSIVQMSNSTLTYPLIGNYGVPDGKKDSLWINCGA
ncbi:hypothetical protein OS493_009286 [Desmophyllum pertusum]|uniref:Carbamoyl-phosphate synthase small subunit N-terminal domain-containing protein n=1 Tax=Desmophyllum pertusum TaxID=174260 RepID=A0A9W9Z552_9CNID|nr:hypothetical protein OS493_009286 [Desmophyllum pertusum]